MYYLETITAIGLKVGSNIQINEFMKLNEYQCQGHYLTLAKGHLDFKIKSCFFFSTYQVIWNQISYESLWVHGNENLYK